MDRKMRLVLIAAGVVLGLTALISMFTGCGGSAYREMAYDPGPVGSGHWRPVMPGNNKDARAILDDLQDAQASGLPTCYGKAIEKVTLFDINQAVGSGIVPADSRDWFKARLLPSGRVAIPCKYADIKYEARVLMSAPHVSLWLEPVCQVYDEASDTVIYRVERMQEH